MHPLLDSQFVYLYLSNQKLPTRQRIFLFIVAGFRVQIEIGVSRAYNEMMLTSVSSKQYSSVR